MFSLGQYLMRSEPLCDGVSVSGQLRLQGGTLTVVVQTPAARGETVVNKRVSGEFTERDDVLPPVPSLALLVLPQPLHVPGLDPRLERGHWTIADPRVWPQLVLVLSHQSHILSCWFRSGACAHLTDCSPGTVLKCTNCTNPVTRFRWCQGGHRFSILQSTISGSITRLALHSTLLVVQSTYLVLRWYWYSQWR